jgi:hypothetical protein
VAAQSSSRVNWPVAKLGGTQAESIGQWLTPRHPHRPSRDSCPPELYPPSQRACRPTTGIEYIYINTPFSCLIWKMRYAIEFARPHLLEEEQSRSALPITLPIRPELDSQTEGESEAQTGLKERDTHTVTKKQTGPGWGV